MDRKDKNQHLFLNKNSLKYVHILNQSLSTSAIGENEMGESFIFRCHTLYTGNLHWNNNLKLAAI